MINDHYGRIQNLLKEMKDKIEFEGAGKDFRTELGIVTNVKVDLSVECIAD